MPLSGRLGRKENGTTGGTPIIRDERKKRVLHFKCSASLKKSGNRRGRKSMIFAVKGGTTEGEPPRKGKSEVLGERRGPTTLIDGEEPSSQVRKIAGGYKAIWGEVLSLTGERVGVVGAKEKGGLLLISETDRWGGRRGKSGLKVRKHLIPWAEGRAWS